MKSLITQVQHINQQSLSISGSLVQLAQLTTNREISVAGSFAIKAHHGQVRKYTEVPYITHTIAVSSIVALVTTDTAMLQAALLHDTVEDTAVTLEEINATFGSDVAELVLGLTDDKQSTAGKEAVVAFKATNHGLTSRQLKKHLVRLKRSTEKSQDRERLAASSSRVQTIKLADLIHNTFSIAMHDPDFARVYLAEKALLLEAMTKGDPQLRDVARVILGDGLREAGGTRSAMTSMSAFI